MALPFLLERCNNNNVPKKVIVVGAGCAGLAMARALHKRSAECEIVIIDPILSGIRLDFARTTQIMSTSTASYDAGRIIRNDYIHNIYRIIASAAMNRWQTLEPWSHAYHRSGLLLASDTTDNGPLMETFARSRDEVSSNGEPFEVEELYSKQDVKRALGTSGDVGGWGYLRHNAGWVHSGDIMRTVLEDLIQSDNICLKSEKVISLQRKAEEDTILGVVLESGEYCAADLVVLATGPWTAGLIDTRGRTVASGETVAYVQLRPEEQHILREMPCFVNFDQKICFTPPTKLVLRVALHRDDSINAVTFDHPWIGGTTISIPPTFENRLDSPLRGTQEQKLRQALRIIFPALSEAENIHFRQCWYEDTFTGDFIVCSHPDFKQLFLLHGLGEHGFKFLNVIGDYAVGILLGEVDTSLAQLWGWPKGRTECQLYSSHGQGGWR
ncbi:uncharacterized protein PV06_11540 [Exophiala oligosperma]|uniref:FAD dependent oxidoreductase domain-containing protein n=1 Tax=Exophiala oligosperma TaxID=215243 RepID=A0A0D2A774_9EURO|nr:uncharacterized protein PV06_11540 [Exophiala oligosperma]KIW36176.1 hypothetical protein PV06_11540 [Exophiala oligosperma]